MPRIVRPGFSHFKVTFSLNGTSTASFSNRLTLRPSTLSSGRDTHFATTGVYNVFNCVML